MPESFQQFKYSKDHVQSKPEILLNYKYKDVEETIGSFKANYEIVAYYDIRVAHLEKTMPMFHHMKTSGTGCMYKYLWCCINT